MKKIIIVFAAILLFFACRKAGNKNATVDCSGPAKSFITDVNPIVQGTCAAGAGCHGAGSINGPGALQNYTQVFNTRSAIRDAIATGRMPLNKRLSASEKNAILCWIDNGAPNN